MTMDSSGAKQIVQALEAIHEPRSTNAQRREAQEFLEKIKQNEEAPFWGFQLALPDDNKNSIVRHFGLLLLQHVLSNKFHTLDRTKMLTVREWVVTLCSKATENDPHYLKEKVAFLWASLAKRVWGSWLVKGDDINQRSGNSLNGLEGNKKAESQSPGQRVALPEDLADGWSSMDADLWALWNENPQCRELSLIITRTLFEDIFLLDDIVASKRSPILNQLSVLIVHPTSVLDQMYEPNPRLPPCKYVSEGWFSHWSSFLLEVLSNNDITSHSAQAFVPKILGAFKTCLHWVQPSVLRNENILNTLINILTVSDVKIKTLAVDCLHILFTRAYPTLEDFDFFVGSIFTSEGIKKLSQFYHSLKIDLDDIDEQTYALLKKTVEMIVSLSEYLNILLPAKNRIDWAKADVSEYLRLILTTTSHPSLIISGLSLQMWVTTLRFDELSSKEPVVNILMDLMEIAANRVINYEWLGEDEPSKKFLEFDFDSALDSSSFLSNYKKFNEDIVRITVCKKPEEGLKWLENRLEAFFFFATRTHMHK